MKFLLTGGLRITFWVAMWMSWGWLLPVVTFLLLVTLVGVNRRSNALYRYLLRGPNGSQIAQAATEIAITILGLWAAGSIWGAPWAAALLVIAVIEFFVME